MKSPLVWIYAVVGSLFATSAANAATLVEQTFSGSYTATAIAGQTISGATGLSGTYGDTSGLAVYSTKNLSFGSLVNTGGSLHVTHQTGDSTVVTSALSLTQSYSGTLYAAYLINFATQSATTSFAETRINNTAGGSATSARFRSMADNNVTKLSGVAYNNPLTQGAGTELSLDTTYLVLSRYTNVGNALSASSPGKADLFILTLSQFNYFKANGFTDAALDSASIGSGSSNIFQKASAPDLASGTFAFTTGNILQLAINSAKAPGTDLYFDAIRYGTSWESVTPIPEPSIASVLVLGASVVYLKKLQSVKKAR